ncbi:MAG: class I SAM-dependent methyltransferase [Gammaproteobacteria bacterium]|nr:class I SAM-dependent methyltransferase [Gammaproteobacteria bacterium]MDP2140644.1 class I SAM-dependent methyltransferase [Gammaproteobacteria bacterium]MDP2347416.1 class I SAM-dependent methyltransferase [Gammaproteobacteria bacterium]
MSLAKLLYGGLASHLPRRAYTMSGQPVDARYGYSVWLRHLVTLHKHGIRGPFRTVVELGPGNSIATGVSALMSGAERYIGLDVLQHLAMQTNTAVLEQVQQLFTDHAVIPDSNVYPRLRPHLDDYSFPEKVLADQRGMTTPRPTRMQDIRDAVNHLPRADSTMDTLRYITPWQSTSLASESVDLVFTQAVLQEIPHDRQPNGLSGTIQTIAHWLKPGGCMSHQIDLGIYGLEPWNLHWKWSGLTWQLVRGRRDNFVNREPLSTYEGLLNSFGLTLIAAERVESDGITRNKLAPRYRHLPEQDLRTRSVTLIAVKQ